MVTVWPSCCPISRMVLTTGVAVSGCADEFMTFYSVCLLAEKKAISPRELCRPFRHGAPEGAQSTSMGVILSEAARSAAESKDPYSRDGAFVFTRSDRQLSKLLSELSS